jgi:hypothetical protein
MSTRDKKRYSALHAIGCIICHIQGFEWTQAEIHHLVDNGYRKLSGGNQATIPLCAWHHRGEPVMDQTIRYMVASRGPSMALESKFFAATFGTQRELLARVNDMISQGKRGIANG